ncbi:MAG: hypothetical protein MJ016_06905, partial [Victivallaceae bacterium]|nr:hypothetical protein [Victivallaceae bacterium]
MIRRQGQYRTELREKMRGGCGTVARRVGREAAAQCVPCAQHRDWWHRYAKDVGCPTDWPPY